MADASEVEGTITVAHEGGDRFAVAVRGHCLTTDQPVADGGTDAGPSPTELFIVGLAGCVGFYARRYLARHDLPETGLGVQARYTLASGPTRVGEVQLAITLPAGVPEERRAALLAVASHCTVHNSLAHAPTVTIELVDGSSG